MTHRQTRPPYTPSNAWRWAVGGAWLGCVLACLIWAPARWLAWAVEHSTQGQVRLDKPRGNVWQGSGQITLSGGAGSHDAQTLPGRLHWRILPMGLNWGLQVQADCCMDKPAQVMLQAGWSRLSVQVDDHLSRWPAAWLSGLGAPWNTLQAEGLLQLRTESLQLQWTAGRLHMQGLAELQAQGLSSRLSTLKPMGSYLVQMRGTPEGTATPKLQLSTLQGPLQLQGQGQWVGSRLRFSGEARADEGAEAALSNLLNIIGRRQGVRSLLSLG